MSIYTYTLYIKICVQIYIEKALIFRDQVQLDQNCHLVWFVFPVFLSISNIQIIVHNNDSNNDKHLLEILINFYLRGYFINTNHLLYECIFTIIPIVPSELTWYREASSKSSGKEITSPKFLKPHLIYWQDWQIWRMEVLCFFCLTRGQKRFILLNSSKFLLKFERWCRLSDCKSEETPYQVVCLVSPTVSCVSLLRSSNEWRDGWFALSKITSSRLCCQCWIFSTGFLNQLQIWLQS